MAIRWQILCVLLVISASLSLCAESLLAQPSAVGSEVPETLHEAALRGEVEAVRFLLRDGADPNAYDRTGLTPLHWAVYGENKAGGKRIKEYISVVEMLLGRGAKPNQKPSSTSTAPFELKDTVLGLAAKWCADGIVSLLLKAGADPNMAMWATPLQEASWAGCPESVSLLIRKGAYVDQKTDGESALDGLGRRSHEAGYRLTYYRDHVEVAKQLVAAGANPTAREAELRLALRNPQNHFLGRRWAKEILGLLQQAMKVQPQSGSVRSIEKSSDQMN